MRGILLFLGVGLASSFACGINHQAEIQTAQEWGESFNKPYPIFVIDRDVTNFLIQSQNASEDEEKRFELIKDYFLKEAEISITKQEFINLDPYMTTHTNSALAMPMMDRSNGEYKFCAVFANAPNGNAEVETNRLVSFNQPEAFTDHPDFNYNNLTEKMSLEELYLFSLYHEVGHCLYDEFLVEANKNGGSPHGIHEAEAYAETLAYLALIPRLGTDVAVRRALYRTIYSRVVGEYLTTVPTFGNPHVASGGAIYNLGPYLYKALELVHFQEIDLSQPLDQVAKDFVLENVLTSREFQAVVNFLKTGSEQTNTQYKEWAFKDPQFFYSSYMELIKYEQYTDDLLRYAFSSTPTPEYDELSELNTNLMCGLIQENNLEEHLKVLNDYRSIINNGLYKTSEITEVYNRLNNLSIDCNEPALQTSKPIELANLH